MWELCIEDVINKLVVVRTPCGNVQGRLLAHDGAMLVVEQANTDKCIVKAWIAIYCIDAVDKLHGFYKSLGAWKKPY
jgi:hypothetical protein